MSYFDILTKAGYRLTTPRKRIAAWLETHNGLFTAADILGSDVTLDKVSVYRTLELLSELDIIHPAGKRGDSTLYEKHADKHHHHISCNNCGKNDCVPCSLPNVRAPGFSNVHHTVVMTGVCSACVT